MRLNQKEIEAIKKVGKMVFGETSKILLFGSRTDDNKRGGDIDLYISYNPVFVTQNKYQLKIEFLVQLKKIIGEQKIDVLIDSGDHRKSILKTVRKQGIQI